MANEEWANEIENLIGGYLDEFIQGSLHRTTNPPDASGNIPQSIDANIRERLATRRYYTLVNELIHDYNQNFRLYQQNMRELINHIREIRPPGTRQTAPPAVASTLFSYVLHPQNNTPATNGLNAEQISRAVETIAYNTTLNETRCPICLEDFVPGEQICKLVVCGHIFKRPGLMSWFARNRHCPVCRRDVVNQAPLNNRNRMSNLFENQLMSELGGILGNLSGMDLSYNRVD